MKKIKDILTGLSRISVLGYLIFFLLRKLLHKVQDNQQTHQVWVNLWVYFWQDKYNQLSTPSPSLVQKNTRKTWICFHAFFSLFFVEAFVLASHFRRRLGGDGCDKSTSSSSSSLLPRSSSSSLLCRMLARSSSFRVSRTSEDIISKTNIWNKHKRLQLNYEKKNIIVAYI